MYKEYRWDTALVRRIKPLGNLSTGERIPHSNLKHRLRVSKIQFGCHICIIRQPNCIFDTTNRCFRFEWGNLSPVDRFPIARLTNILESGRWLVVLFLHIPSTIDRHVLKQGIAYFKTRIIPGPD
jgi:hypothetical protein